MNQINQTTNILYLNLLILDSNLKKRLYSTDLKPTSKDNQLGPYLAGLIEGDGS